MKAIKNGTIYTMTGEIINNGMIVFDEKIVYIGKQTDEFAVDEWFDAQGYVVTPGLIDAPQSN